MPALWCLRTESLVKWQSPSRLNHLKHRILTLKNNKKKNKQKHSNKLATICYFNFIL
jgi:hypothetical protein